MTDFFKENQEEFTIYVVEQRFVVGRGINYFKSYRGTKNFFDKDEQVRRKIAQILDWIAKRIPNIASLVNSCFNNQNPTQLDIGNTITSLCNLFATHEHQAAGPEVIDPIIIQEGKVLKKHLTELITLHKSSILRPIIIILLQDNDFDRAKKLLSSCPHGMNVKLIRNNGTASIYKVINTGTENIDDFLTAYSRHCFSTCSRTKRDIIMNEDWANNSVLKYYSPILFKIRSNLLIDDKSKERNDISYVVNDINKHNIKNTTSNDVGLAIECMARLSKVYCFDKDTDDMTKAFDIAKELDNDMLLAHTYRYSFFLNNVSEKDKILMLDKAEEIFKKNNVLDHSIYCRNNKIIKQFYADNVDINEFDYIQKEAINNVPGLVGMSYILNNVGVAHLYNINPEKAIECFKKGLDYASDRIVTRVGLMCNLIIAKDYAYQRISENEINKIVKYTFDSGILRELPFIASNYIMNCIILAQKHYPDLANEIIIKYPIYKLLIETVKFGHDSVITLVQQLVEYNNDNKLPYELEALLNKEYSYTTGRRFSFIESQKCNPIIFHTWL